MNNNQSLTCQFSLPLSHHLPFHVFISHPNVCIQTQNTLARARPLINQRPPHSSSQSFHPFISPSVYPVVYLCMYPSMQLLSLPLSFFFSFFLFIFFLSPFISFSLNQSINQLILSTRCLLNHTPIT